jgi:hypothetical protein
MDNEDKPRNQDKGNFWTTLPGILTALAGFMTALTALIAGLHQIGLIGAKADPQTSSASTFSTTPSLSPTATSTPTSTSTPTPSPTPSSSLTSTLEGQYSLTWVAQPGTQCYPGSIQQLTISADGFMQGVYSGNSTVTFSGKVDSDGTWSGALSNFGLSFKGNLRDGELTGTYIQQYGSLSCQGAVEGYKIPGRSS